jgi:FkbM family methyltransferase
MSTGPSKFLGEVYETDQGLFCVRPEDQFVAKELISTGSYSAGELALLALFVNEKSNVLMLGGHIGAIAVPLSRRIAELTVFEANPETYKLLKLNLRLNNCANVRHFNMAANDVHGELQFVMNTVNSGGSKRMPREKHQDFFHDDPEIRTVPACRLDDQLAGQSFDLIFMDIEGSEYFAMKGMPRLIERTRVLVTEFLPHHLSLVAGITVSDFLSPLGEFNSLIVPSRGKVVYRPEMHDFLARACAEGRGEAAIVFHKDVIALK